MASSTNLLNGLDTSEDFTSSNSPSTVNSKLFSDNINGIITDFVLIRYSNRIFITVTENKKIGNLYSIHTNSPQRNGIQTQVPTVYDIKCLLGSDSEEKLIAVRALVEKLAITQPILLSLTISSLNYETVEAVAKNILDKKCW